MATIGGLLCRACLWILPVSTWALALGWCWQLGQWLRNLSRVPDLTELPPDSLPSLSAAGPHLTVVVPACNEQESIEATLRSLLASQEVRLQIIAVDDRSTDRTGQIVDEVMNEIAVHAPADGSTHTLQVLHIGELPAGWLGKPHALAAGARLAQSDWILFTDGDVLFAPQAVALALGFALAEQADHLVLMPGLTAKSHGEAAMLGAIYALSTWMLRLWRIADPSARDSLGVGAFNLVRRRSFEALGGFTTLRMEVLEDLCLGSMLKRAGYCQRVALGPGLATVRWSKGAWGVVRNLEKNLFALYRYRVSLTLFGCLLLAVQIALPLAAIFSWHAGSWTRVAAVVLYAAVAGLYIITRRVTRVSPAYVLLYPVAVSVLLFAQLRSMALALARGGILWRDTFYSLKELRTHASRLR